MKMPDFSELTKKVNIQGMMDNVKSAIDTVSAPKAPPKSDELAAKFSEITTLMNSLADMNEQQAKAVANIKAKVQALDKDIQTIKSLAVEVGEKHSAANTVPETTEVVEEVKAEVVEDIKEDIKLDGDQSVANKPAVEEPLKEDK